MKDKIYDKLIMFLKEDPDTRERIPEDFNRKTSLIEENILDSFSLVKFITFIEKEFEFKFSSKDLKEESFLNLESVRKVILKNEQPKLDNRKRKPV